MRKRSVRLESGNFIQVLLMPLLVCAAGFLLLYAVSFIPREWIQEHALASAYQINDEAWPRDWTTNVGHTEFDRGLTTDSLSVMVSYTLDRQHPENLLLKKITVNPNTYGTYRYLIDTVEGNEETDLLSYSRYCMGFRLLIRPLLVVTAYYGIRILAAGLLAVLFCIALVTTAKRSSGWVSLALALSVGMLEPWAIAATLSYTTCINLLLLLIIILNCANLKLSDGRTFQLFCLFGALTQFFDFYTFPLLVCTLPLLVLIARYTGSKTLRYAGRISFGWFFSWIVTWLINMILVSLFTPENGIADAFRSAAFRLGVKGFRESATSYSVPEAFRSVWAYLKLPSVKIVLPALLVLLVALYVFSRVRCGKNERIWSYLAVGGLGLVWIAATAQPIIIHVSMQYRCVGALYLGLMLYLLDTLGILSGRNTLVKKLWAEEKLPA